MKRFAKPSTVIHRAFAPSWSIFEGYINRLSMREGTDLYGEPRTYLNEDIKRELMIELIVKLPLFDCEK